MKENKETELKQYRAHLKAKGYILLNDMQVELNGNVYDIIYQHYEPHEGVIVGCSLKLHTEADDYSIGYYRSLENHRFKKENSIKTKYIGNWIVSLQKYGYSGNNWS